MADALAAPKILKNKCEKHDIPYIVRIRRSKSGGTYSENRCPQCHSETVLKWHNKYKHTPEYKAAKRAYEAKNKEKFKNDALKRNYGITLEQYNQMFAAQEGKCGICKKHQSELKTTLAVDHNHTTKNIRGLLCSKCNMSLGGFKDKKDNLTNAIIYLEKAGE